MLVLGVESSCDETALALVNEAGVVASVMATQMDLHALFGGVVPELASREHARLIGPLCDELWRQAFPGLDPEEGWRRVDRVAVARGPGLLGSLLVGVAFAKALAVSRSLPLVGVNHLHAHLLVAGLPHKGAGTTHLEFPALGVLVSGGHTHLYRMDSPSSMTALGRTLDDAAGEACDKFAKMAGLPYPGGALLDMLGKRGKAEPRMFPRPYINNDTLDFSFSGLKTAGALWLKNHPDAFFPHGLRPVKERLEEDAPQILCDAAASFLLAVAETLAIKAERAMGQFSPRCIVVAGGVAANSVVRRVFGELAARKSVPLLIPPLSLCTDNGVMIAWNGLLLAKEGMHHNLEMPAIPRGKPIPNDFVCA